MATLPAPEAQSGVVPEQNSGPKIHPLADQIITALSEHKGSEALALMGDDLTVLLQEDGETLAHKAAWYGAIDVLKAIQANTPALLKQADKNTKTTPLHFAYRSSAFNAEAKKAVAFLVPLCPDLANAQNRAGYKPSDMAYATMSEKLQAPKFA